MTITPTSKPPYDKYCMMSIIPMLNSCKYRHMNALKNLEASVSGLTDKYYDMSEVPVEVADKIAALNEKICKCVSNIENINTAIDVMSGDMCD